MAREFVDSGWNVKGLIEKIVLSETYRRDSAGSYAKDPENRLLARQARFRLPAELVRDNALAASGLLVPTVGGPSVRPYMPKGVWDETNFYGNLRNYKNDSGDGLYRRSLYTFWKRTVPPPGLATFDAADRSVCTVKRQSTHTPLQALVLLNETQFVEAARFVGERMLREGGATAEQRVAWAFRLIAGRAPEIDMMGLDLSRFG